MLAYYHLKFLSVNVECTCLWLIIFFQVLRLLYVTFPSSNFVRIIGEVALTGQHCWISANELCPTAMHKVS